MKFNIALLPVTLVFLATLGARDVNAQNNEAPSAADIRHMIEGEIASFQIPPQKVARVENRVVWNGNDSINIRIYYPAATKKLPIIFNIHGGAMVAGNLDTHDNISRILANRTQCIVIALDYRKPPEHPFPASLNDCTTVLGWIKTNAASFDGDADKLILVGDSGGGLYISNLVVNQKADLGAKGIVLINPANDLRNADESPYGLVVSWYLGAQNPADSSVSPILARNLATSPPTLVITSGKDFLKPQGEAWYGKLKASGVTATLFDIPGADHLGGFWAAGHPAAAPAVEATVTFILKILK